MQGLITDRGQVHVDRRNELAAKGWNAMTEAEQAEWTGNILTPHLAGYTEPVNLLPNNNFYPGSADLKFKNKEVIATSISGGIYNYAIAVVGDAADFTNKTMTLSFDSVFVSGNGTPQVAAYWHDENGFEYAGASLSAPGHLTFRTEENAQNRANLALYIYVTTDKEVAAGDFVRYTGLMLEMGDVKHEYMPYMQTLPTAARKGSYNYSDLNRVEKAVEEIAESFGLELTTKTDWNEWDIPKQSDMERYLGNVAAIARMVPLPAGMPVLPSSMSGLTYTAANDIERILSEVYTMSAFIYRSGEIYSGEV